MLNACRLIRRSFKRTCLLKLGGQKVGPGVTVDQTRPRQDPRRMPVPVSTYTEQSWCYGPC